VVFIKSKKTFYLYYFKLELFEILEDDNSILFVIDEVGFGTQRLRKYAYSIIGKPAVYETTKKLVCNLTCTATISYYGVEMIRFFFGSGTRNEYFYDYFDKL
jgi:hypothetical protein